MIPKLCLILILCSSLLFPNGHKDSKMLLKILDNNRKELLDCYNKCNSGKITDVVVVPKIRAQLQKPLDSTLSIFGQNDLFYEIIQSAIMYGKNGEQTGFIEDSLLVSLCIQALAVDTIYVRRDIYQIMVKNIRIDDIQKNAATIKKNLLLYQSDMNLCFPYYEMLLLRLPLTQEEKDSLIEKRKELIKEGNSYPLGMQVRLGVKGAEDSLIAHFKNAKTAYGKELPIREMGYAGTPACIKAMIWEINDTNYYTLVKHGGVCERSFIVKALNRLRPGKFESDMGKTDINLSEVEKQRKLILDILEWAKKNYNAVPRIPEPIPFFGKVYFLQVFYSE